MAPGTFIRPLMGLLFLGACFWAIPGPSRAQSPAPSLSEGRELYVESCASCHGAGGEGTSFGPPVTGSGAAGTDFMLRTGRMPLASEGAQAVRKEPAFDEQQIAAITDYVASLGPGPSIPEVHEEEGDLSRGQMLFVQNCAACHGSTGNGGAAGKDVLAPSLYRSSALDVAEAVIVGPGEMPVFDFSDEELGDVGAYVQHLRSEEDPGGADIGGVGPVPEGFVAWAVGMGSLALICILIGGRAPRGER